MAGLAAGSESGGGRHVGGEAHAADPASEIRTIVENVQWKDCWSGRGGVF